MAVACGSTCRKHRKNRKTDARLDYSPVKVARVPTSVTSPAKCWLQDAARSGSLASARRGVDSSLTVGDGGENMDLSHGHHEREKQMERTGTS